MNELMYSAVLYVNCNNKTCKTVLEKANKSRLNTKSFKPSNKTSQTNVVINLKGSKEDIKVFSQDISIIKGVKSARCVIFVDRNV